mmetsp:Transcript_83039/g.230625  ORF Transcript_83039/g.230625 Transcript_83039/m.230625 type:complete len:198 (-) Transcript_83039:158-751(-)
MGQKCDCQGPPTCVSSLDPDPELKGFSAIVDRADAGTAGLEVDITDAFSLVVVSVKDGAVQAFNKATPEKAIQTMDRIVEVNGARGDARDLLARFRSDATWKLLIQRPKEVKVRVKKKSAAQKTGMELKYADNSISLLIAELREGPIKDWNKDNPMLQVSPNDRIVEMNGTRGPAKALLQASEGSAALDMIVAHYSA